MRNNLLLKAFTLVMFTIMGIVVYSQESIDEQKQKENTKKHVNDLLSKSSFVFIENKGQFVYDNGAPMSDVFFKGTSKAGEVWITEKGLTYVFTKCHADIMDPDENKTLKQGDTLIEWNRVDMNLIGAHIMKDNIVATEPSETYYNYYYAHCPDGILNVHAYKTITISSIYPGIDWVIYCNGEYGVKYDFIVHPHAKTDLIKMSYAGAENMNLSDNKDKLTIKSKLGSIVEGDILTYENISGKKIDANYVKNGNTVSFTIKGNDQNEELIIDPPLLWGTYNGTTNHQGVYGITRTPSDSIFAVGYTDGNINPVNLIGAQTWGQNPNYDACIFKFDNFGKCVWATYYGGTGIDVGWDVAVDNNWLYIVGNTASTTFPLQNAFQGVYGGGTGTITWHTLNYAWGGDGFFLKFNTGGTRFVSSYFGGSDEDGARSISVSAGHAFIVGSTKSANLNVTGNAIQPVIGAGGGTDAFLLDILEPSGTIFYTSFLGGTGDDFAWDVAAVANHGNPIYVHVVGDAGAGFPILNQFQTWGGGSSDAFITKFDFSSNPFRVWSTYFGGAGDDIARVCLYAGPANLAGPMYIACQTNSNSLPTCTNTYNNVTHNYTYQGMNDMHFLSIDPMQAVPVILWGAYFGSPTGDDIPMDLALDPNSSNYVYLVGQSSADNFNPIITNGPPCTFNQPTRAGGTDGIIIRLDPSSTCAVNWSTYHGGTNSVNPPFPSTNDWLRCDVVDSHGCLFAAGEENSTTSTNPSVLANPGLGARYYSNFSGTDNQFFTKICDCPQASAGPNKTIAGPCCLPVQIGCNAMPCFTYSWSPTTGLSCSTCSNPLASAAGTFTLTVTNIVLGCTSTASVQVSMGTTVCCQSPSGGGKQMNQPLPKNTIFNVFPNPNSGLFTVQFEEGFSENISLSVSDAFGRLVFEKKNFVPQQNMEINMENEQRGFYFLRAIRPSGETIVRKIVVQ